MKAVSGCMMESVTAFRVCRSGSSGAAVPVFPVFRFIALSALLFSTQVNLIAAVTGHPHSISGTVLEGGEPLAGVTVILEPGGYGRVTDAEGKYTFGAMPAGLYSLIFKSPGYRTDTVAAEVRMGETTVVATELVPAPIELNQVEISASGEDGHHTLMRLDMRLNPVFSSQEVLRKIPGLFIGQHAGGGKAEQMFLRGYDLDHGTDFSITVDGLPVNMVSHAHGQGYADLHFLIPELIDNISYELGPYDVTRGNLATAGSANLQTKQILKDHFVKMEGGSFGTFRSLVMLRLLGDADGKSQQHAFVAGEQVTSRGYFEDPQDFHRLNLYGKYRLRIGTAHQLTATASCFSSRWNASGQVPQRAVNSGLISPYGAIDDREGGETNRTNLHLMFKSFFHRGGVLSQHAYFSDVYFQLYSNFTFFAVDSVHGDQIRQKENRKIAGYHLNYAYTGSLLGKTIRLQAGGDIRADLVRGLELSRTYARSVTLEPLQLGRVGEVNTGGYAEGVWDISARIQAAAGVRMDFIYFSYLSELSEADLRWQKKKTGTVNPKLRLQYHVNENFNFFLKAGSGFHSNDSRIAADAQAAVALPRAWSADAGVLFKPVAHLFIQSGIWAMTSGDEFVYVGDEGIVESAGRSRRVGADILLRWQPLAWLFADMQANITLPRLAGAPAGENYIPLAPLFSSTGGITLTPCSALTGSIRYRYLADRPANEDFSLTADGYLLADVQMVWTTGYFEFGISVINAMNTFWKETQFETTSRLRDESSPVTEIHFTPGAPRTWKISAGVKF